VVWDYVPALWAIALDEVRRSCSNSQFSPNESLIDVRMADIIHGEKQQTRRAGELVGTRGPQSLGLGDLMDEKLKV